MSFRRVSLFASPRKFKMAVLRHKAQRKLEKAVASGKVKKPTRCQRCRKKLPKHKLQGHHYRGNRYPLDVKWYCQPCHYTKHSISFQRKAMYRMRFRLSGLIGH